MIDLYIPDPVADLKRFIDNLKSGAPFTFIRFSDGEIEILRNRYLEINEGVTVFRGQTFNNDFPAYDAKRFDPEKNIGLRQDLLRSAIMRRDRFFKGIPAGHNRAEVDRDFLLRLNGGMSEMITFSDLFLNSNYSLYRERLVVEFSRYESIAVIANYRSVTSGVLAGARIIPVGDNFFASYLETLSSVMKCCLELPESSLVLSSASSLTNIVGMKLFDRRPDLTFLDIGTSLNDLLGLDSKTRAYHQLYKGSSDSGLMKGLRYKLSKQYQLKWK